MDVVNIVCIKWGDRYGPEYVNRLYAGVSRHLSRPFRFVCLTEKPQDINEDVVIVPFPSDPGIKRGWPDVLVKLMLFKDGFGDLKGPTLFLDLDVVIVDSMDCFFDYKPGKNCIIHNWASGIKSLMGKRLPVGNSSIFRFEAGQTNYAYETFVEEMHRAEDRTIFNTEQAFLTYALKSVEWWPEAWARSYKRHCRPIFPLNLWVTPRLPKDCRIMVFHGRPDPDEAVVGYHGKKLHHHVKSAPWVAEHWLS